MGRGVGQPTAAATILADWHLKGDIIWNAQRKCQTDMVFARAKLTSKDGRQSRLRSLRGQANPNEPLKGN